MISTKVLAFSPFRKLKKFRLNWEDSKISHSDATKTVSNFRSNWLSNSLNIAEISQSCQVPWDPIRLETRFLSLDLDNSMPSSSPTHLLTPLLPLAFFLLQFSQFPDLILHQFSYNHLTNSFPSLPLSLSLLLAISSPL